MSKIDSALFNTHEHALENESCPECGNKLAIRYSKKGAFIGCNGYPECQYIRPLVSQSTMEDQIIDDSTCPLCEKGLVVRSGRYGLFICCVDYPKCQYTEKLAQQDAAHKIACPNCKKGNIESKTNRFGKTFYGCSNYPSCKFLINYLPIDEPCPDCGFGILIKRKYAANTKLECLQKSCNYKRVVKPTENGN